MRFDPDSYWQFHRELVFHPSRVVRACERGWASLGTERQRDLLLKTAIVSFAALVVIALVFQSPSAILIASLVALDFLAYQTYRVGPMPRIASRVRDALGGL